MIQVKQSKQSIVVNGHAMFSASGSDIVCAGVSSIVFGALNALDYFGELSDSIEINDQRGFISIHFTEYNKQQLLVIETMMIQLKTVEDQFPNYIKIES